jgi:hypothetical protein
MPKYLDNDAYKVVEGAVPEITRLLELQCELNILSLNSSTKVFPTPLSVYLPYSVTDYLPEQGTIFSIQETLV